MTIDEAITHCLEVAKEQDKLATRYEDASGYSRTHIESLRTNESIKCRECAKEHRQLAEWLKELKKWRTLRDSINMLCDVDCEYPQYRESGTMCDACPIGTVKEYFEQIFDGEVNADE